VASSAWRETIPSGKGQSRFFYFLFKGYLFIQNSCILFSAPPTSTLWQAARFARWISIRKKVNKNFCAK